MTSVAAPRSDRTRPPSPEPPPPAECPPGAATLLVASAVALIAFGSRCWTIATFGTDLPFWDQWDGEARTTFLPWLAGHFTWHDLVRAHNEHRIILTRLLDLALLSANGRWDARLEAVLGAVLYSALGGLLVAWTARRFSRRAQFGFAAATAAAFAVPYAYENILGGFQLQMFLLLILSLSALRLLIASAPLTLESWAGIALATLCLGTMASGFFAAAAALPVLFWAAAYDAPVRTRTAGLGAALLLIVAAGWVSQVSVPGHAPFLAHSPREFFWALGRFTAWPRWRHAWIGVIFALPWLILMGSALRQRTGPSSSVRWLAALGLWALLQIAALAYGRKPDPFPAPRYLDLLLLWQLINVAALITLVAGSRQRAVQAAAGLWFAFLVIVFVPVTHKDLRPELTGWRDDSRQYERSVRAYVATGDPVWLDGKIPYPWPASLRALLDEESLQEILPASVARPPAQSGRLSRAARAIAGAGPLILAAGLALFAAALLRGRRPQTASAS